MQIHGSKISACLAFELSGHKRKAQVNKNPANFSAGLYYFVLLTSYLVLTNGDDVDALRSS